MRIKKQGRIYSVSIFVKLASSKLVLFSLRHALGICAFTLHLLRPPFGMSFALRRVVVAHTRRGFQKKSEYSLKLKALFDEDTPHGGESIGPSRPGLSYGKW